ncbi:GntR family transcriptional regulator [Streptomyces sp. NPDC004959]|uniref:GntR family transcriptional regulator n=1 Tax=unclassified Streptomyces TaxID=2593676 RepID=UPI0004C68121|nr:GntR family transcriptional regulator [Streptomyces sp. NRRL F-5630]
MEREPAPRGPHPADGVEERVPPPRRPGEDAIGGTRGRGAARGSGTGARPGGSARPPGGPACPADLAHGSARGQDHPGHARTPLRRTSVRGQVLEALRAALDSGELEAGRVYSAPALGERYGVSATPVREAMQRLAAEGAVETVPNRGFRVLARTDADAAALAEVLLLIELPVLTRLAATLPALPPELRPLAARAEELARTGDRTGYGEADRAFHAALLGLHGNPELTRVADALHRRAGSPRARTPRPWAEEAAQHTALLDAIERADTATLATVLRSHLGVRG